MKHVDQASIAKATIHTRLMTLGQAKQFFSQWQNAQGILFLSVPVKKQKIRVHYDVNLIRLERILESIELFSIEPNPSWFSRWRLRIAQQVEQNVIDNIRHVPHCCAKAPKLK